MKGLWSRASTMLRGALAAGGTLVLAALMFFGYVLLDDVAGIGGRGSGSAGGATVSGTEISGLLDTLVIADEASMKGYDRDKFPHWEDNDPEHGFGDEYTQYSSCTTRDVMLLRDATGAVTLDPTTCDLTVGPDGGWRDEYGFTDRKTGALLPYKWITEPSDVDAEHIVALAEAWRSGAEKLDTATRRNIANDAINLEASDPSANRSKGDQDVADYLPPGQFRCEYVQRYVNIKVKYALTVDSAEHTALRSVVNDCIDKGEFT